MFINIYQLLSINLSIVYLFYSKFLYIFALSF